MYFSYNGSNEMICMSHSTGQSLAVRHLHPDLSSDGLLTSMSIVMMELVTGCQNDGKEDERNVVYDDCMKISASSANAC
jgi:hypothetical protein